MPITSSSTWRWTLGTLALLGASAYYVNKKQAQAEAHNPPKGRFINVDGVKLHYTEHGDPSAPPLVMLHGLGSMSTEMELSGLVEMAARQYRVLVFDRPGYGHSERPLGHSYTADAQAELFLQALNQLNVNRPVIVAHSWATLIAISMAASQPQALKGLVLLGGYYTPSARLDVLISSAPAIPLVGPLLANTVSPLVARLIWRPLMWRIFSPASSNIQADFIKRYPKWMTLRPSTLSAAAVESAMLIPEAVKHFFDEARPQIPVVIVAGESDRLLMSGWHSQRLLDRLPNARIRMVQGAGHMVHHAAPEVVFEEIRHVSSMVLADTPVELDAAAKVAPEDEPLLHTSQLTH